MELNIEKRPHNVSFGKVEGEFRGLDNLMDPPIIHNDDYHWLRDDKRERQDVKNVIDRENQHYRENINLSIAEQIEHEILLKMQKDYSTHPHVCHDKNSHLKYFYKFEDNKDHKIFCRLNTETNITDVLLDVNEISLDHDQCDVTQIAINFNEQIMSYGVDFTGSEHYEIVFINLITGNRIETQMETVPYANYFWLNDCTIVFIRENDSKKPYQILFYDIYSRETTLKFTELNETMSLCAYLSSDRKYLFASSSDYDKNNLFFLPTNSQEFIPMCDYVDDTLITVDHKDDQFYFLTNVNGSTNYKICTMKDTEFVGTVLDQRLFDDLIPYNENVSIKEFELFHNKFIFTTSIHGSDYINYYYPETNDVYTFNLQGYESTINISDWSEHIWEPISNIYSLTMYANVFNNNHLTVGMESMISPLTEYQIMICNITVTQMDTNVTQFKPRFSYNHFKTWSKECPNYDPGLYTCTRLYADNNGTKIPISIMYKKSHMENKNMPLYLYGYGAYGTTVDALFNFKNIPLLDQGMCFAIAHPRGGGFLGQTWYEQGRMEHKHNTFEDFVTCARYMKGQDYIDSNNIICEGRSAGGLLTGHMVSHYPDDFNTIIMGVPFTDVLNTMCDSSIPLTIEEWTQWGNPNVLKDYNIMKEYCPYTNLKPSNFPNVYITAGYHDPRVQYWEGLKFIAKLRDNNRGNNKHVIEIQMGQGHFGNAGRYKAINEKSKQISFIIDNLNK